MEERLDMTQPWALTAQEAKRVLGCIQSNVGSRRGRGFCPCALLSETPPAVLHPAQGPQDMDLLERVQRRPMKLIRGTDHLS